MTKKFLALMLAVLMICTLGVIPVSAAEPTLQDLINNPVDGKVTLDKDYLNTGSVIIDESLTLDLNGYSITATDNATPIITVTGAGVEVTIKDSSEDGTGKIISEQSAVEVTNDAELVLESGYIKGYYGVRVSGTDDMNHTATFTMNGGQIESDFCGIFVQYKAILLMTDGKISAKVWGISGNGMRDGSTITIKGGKVYSTEQVAIYQPQQGKLTIEDGYFEGPSAVYIKSGNIEIKGGEFVGNGTACPVSPVDDGAQPTGSAIVIEQKDAASNYGVIEKVTISAGSFKSENAAPIVTHDAVTTDEEEAPKNFISGGTFKSEAGVQMDTTNLLVAGSDGLNENGTPRTSHTVTFVAGATTVGSRTYYYGDASVAEPAVPAKDGYVGYWEAYELDGKNITVYAKYVKAPTRGRVSFVADGRLVGIVLYREGQTDLTYLPKVPAKEGYVGAWDAYTLTGKNLIIRAVYTPVAE